MAKGSATAAMLVSVLVAAGCRQRGPAPQISVDRAAAADSARSARELDAALESVETRLYSGRATVRLWQELAVRHKGVSAVACVNAEVHSDGMELANRKERAQLAKHRVARTGRGAVTGARVTGYRDAPVPETQKAE